MKSFSILLVLLLSASTALAEGDVSSIAYSCDPNFRAIPTSRIEIKGFTGFRKDIGDCQFVVSCTVPIVRSKAEPRSCPVGFTAASPIPSSCQKTPFVLYQSEVMVQTTTPKSCTMGGIFRYSPSLKNWCQERQSLIESFDHQNPPNPSALISECVPKLATTKADASREFAAYFANPYNSAPTPDQSLFDRIVGNLKYNALAAAEGRMVVKNTVGGVLSGFPYLISANVQVAKFRLRFTDYFNVTVRFSATDPKTGVVTTSQFGYVQSKGLLNGEYAGPKVGEAVQTAASTAFDKLVSTLQSIKPRTIGTGGDGGSSSSMSSSSSSLFSSASTSSAAAACLFKSGPVYVGGKAQCQGFVVGPCTIMKPDGTPATDQDGNPAVMGPQDNAKISCNPCGDGACTQNASDCALTTGTNFPTSCPKIPASPACPLGNYTAPGWCEDTSACRNSLNCPSGMHRHCILEDVPAKPVSSKWVCEADGGIAMPEGCACGGGTCFSPNNSCDFGIGKACKDQMVCPPGKKPECTLPPLTEINCVPITNNSSSSANTSASNSSSSAQSSAVDSSNTSSASFTSTSTSSSFSSTDSSTSDSSDSTSFGSEEADEIPIVMDESSSSSFSEESSTYASSASSNGKVCVQTVAEKSDFCDGTSQTGVLRPAGCEMKDASAAPKMGDKTHRYKFDRACTPRSEYEVKNKLKKVKHAEGFIERMEGSCDFYYDDKGNRNENGIDYEKTWDERGFQVIAPKRGFCNPFKK